MKGSAEFRRRGVQLSSDRVKTRGFVFIGVSLKLGRLSDQSHSFLLLLRVTAAARTISALLGFLRCTEKDRVLAARTARRASGPAIDIGGAHSKEEFAFGAQIAVNRGAPEFGGGLRRDAVGLGTAFYGDHALNLQRTMIAIYPV